MNQNLLTDNTDQQPTLLTRPDFKQLANVPPEVEWFANIRNQHTRRAYQKDVQAFCDFIGIEKPDQCREVTRAHIIAWRNHLDAQALSAATIRRKLSALSALFNHLCESNAILHNPVQGVTRPGEGANEGKTPALSDAQARRLLEAPPNDTLKGKRDQAIIAVLLYQGLRREELTKLKTKDIEHRQGVKHLRIHGKRDAIRYVPIHPMASRLVDAYLEEAGHHKEKDGPLFRPVKNNVTGTLNKPLHPDVIYSDIVRHYAKKIGLLDEINSLGAHAMRATAATNSLENEADIAKVQEMLGHKNIATTRLYDRRQTRPEDSPVFKISY